MSTPNTSDTGQPAKSSLLKMKISNWLYAFVGLIVACLGLLQIYNAVFPGLPSCTSDTAGRSIRDIFKQKNVQLTSLTDQKTITESSSEETCQANFLTPAETGTLYYRIYWQDKSSQILITKVDTHPR